MAHQIQCGHCHQSHASIAAVKACAAGNLFPCHWAVEFPGRWVVVDDETGESDYIEGGIRDCGADAIATERGWTCAVGHEHVNTQTRWNEGWDYAEDAGEAMNLVRAGRQPFTMDGHLATSPADFAPSFALAGVR